MAMKLRGKLTAARVRQLSKLGRHGNGHGLYLQVSNVAGRVTKSWVIRYVSLLPHPSGKRRDSKGKPKLNWVRDLGLGSADVVDIDEARKRAQAERNKLYGGIDPIEERRLKEGARKAEVSRRAVTFRQAAQEYVNSVANKWRGGIAGRQAQQWTQSLTDYAFPVVGQLPVAMRQGTHARDPQAPLGDEDRHDGARQGPHRGRPRLRQRPRLARWPRQPCGAKRVCGRCRLPA
jgi:hypothetical protein